MSSDCIQVLLGIIYLKFYLYLEFLLIKIFLFLIFFYILKKKSNKDET